MAGDDLEVVAKGLFRVPERDRKENRAKNWLSSVGDGQLRTLHFQTKCNVWEGMRGVIIFCRVWIWLTDGWCMAKMEGVVGDAHSPLRVEQLKKVTSRAF